MRALASTCVASLFFLTLGCENNPFRMFSARTDAHFEKAKRDIQEAATSTAEALSSARSDYVTEYVNRLAALDKKYREVQETGREATGAAKAQVMARLQQLDEQKQDIRQRLDEYRKANDKAADNLRVGLEAAMNEYTNALLTPPLPVLAPQPIK